MVAKPKVAKPSGHCTFSDLYFFFCTQNFRKNEWFQNENLVIVSLLIQQALWVIRKNCACQPAIWAPLHQKSILNKSLQCRHCRQADTERSAADKSQSDVKEVQGSASDRHPVIDNSDYSEIEFKDGVYSALSHCKSYESYETAAAEAEERSADDELTASEDQR